MKSAVETLNPTRVKLTVEVAFDELKPSLDAAYKAISKQVSIPGFRKGKVPPRIIDQRIGRGAVVEEAVNEALPRFYAQAVQESSVRPLGQPTVDVTAVPDAAGSGLTFTAEVDVAPDIELPELENIAVSVDDLSVDDEAVNQRVEGLRERFGTLATVDKAASDGDFVSLDLSARIEDEEIDSVTNVSYQVGSGTMLDGLDEAVTGLSAGEATTFQAPLKGGDHAGEEALVTITVQAVKERNLPNLDDDFAALASEFDTLGELMADLREGVEKTSAFEQGIQARERLLDHLLESVDVPLPDGVIADEVHRHLENESRLEDDEHRTEVEEQARKSLKTQLLLDAIVDKLEVSVTQREFVEYLVATAQQYGMDPNTFAKMVEEGGQVPSLASEVARRKALILVLRKATVTDASGSAVDIESLFAGDEDVDDEGAQVEAVGPEESDEDVVIPEGGPTVHAAASDDPTAVSIPIFDLPAGEVEEIPPRAGTGKDD